MTEHDTSDDEIAAAARTLHREWDSPELWPSIAERMPERSSMPTFLAVAAGLLLFVLSATWMTWHGEVANDVDQTAAADRLLNDAALEDIERAEEQYVRAIDELARLAAPQLEMPDSPAVEGLRERLAAIDAAIAEHRTEIARNPFNAHLREQLLWIYQEKRRTLQEVQEYVDSTL